MTRAYLRLDPLFDEHKEGYPDGAYAALVSTFCLAESQPARGRFRNLDYYRRLLGKRGRWARFLIDHDDVTILDDGRIYVVGWDEWQEGDWKVNERVDRIRHRRSRTVPVTVAVTPDVTVPVTVDVTDGRIAVGGGVAVGGKREAVSDEPLAVVDGLTPVLRYSKLTGNGIPKASIQEWINQLANQYGVEEFIFCVNMARELNGSSNDLRNAGVLLEERRVKREGEERTAAAARQREAASPERAAAQRALVAELTGKVKSI